MKKTNIIPATTKNAIILSRPIPNLMNSQIKSSVNNIESIIEYLRFLWRKLYLKLIKKRYKIRHPKFGMPNFLLNQKYLKQLVLYNVLSVQPLI